MPLNKNTQNVLRALATGSTLKSHRYLDGTKVFKLHDLNGSEQAIPQQIVADLLERSYVTSNHKFPAATYTITPNGKIAAKTLK